MIMHTGRLATLIGAVAFVSLASGYTAAVANSSELTTAQIVAAKSASDHEAIARAYEDDAAALEEKAQVHDAMAKVYQSSRDAKTQWKAPAMGTHCERLASQYRLTALEARALAAEHRAVARMLQQ